VILRIGRQMIQTWCFLIHKFRTDERDMRRFQELTVAIGLRCEPRLVLKNHLASVQAAR
jgi:hypothetical protein